MLNWLKRVTNYQPAPVKLAEIEARLSEPGGGKALWGDIEFDTYADGGWKLEIEIEHPKSTPEGPLDVRFNGQSITQLDPDRGHDTEVTYRSGHFDLAQTPMIGTAVEVHRPSGLMLAGTFADDRR